VTYRGTTRSLGPVVLVALVLALFAPSTSSARPTGSTGDFIDVSEIFDRNATVGDPISIGVDMTFTQNFYDRECYTTDTDAHLTSGPSGASVSWGIRTGSVNWTPTSADLGENAFTVQVEWEGQCLDEEGGSSYGPASDVESEDFVVTVVYGCDVLFDWIGGPYPNPILRGDPQYGDFKLAILDDSGQASGADLVVKVYNAYAQLVYTKDLGFYLANENFESPTEILHRLLWEGENQSGYPVAAGTYFIQVTATPNSSSCDPAPIDDGSTVF